MSKRNLDSDQPWHELGGLSFAFASDIAASPSQALSLEDQSPLAIAIRKAWSDSDPTYQRMVQRRYCEVFHVPPVEAVAAVNAGYSSPQSAMRARIIRKRKRIGFIGERAR